MPKIPQPNVASLSPNILTAIYRPGVLPEYAGNPLIEALPPFHQSHELIDAFGRFPHISEEERLFPAHMRMMAISRLNDYLEPLSAHWSVIDNIGLIVRAGYVNRNPLDHEYRLSLNRFYRESMDGQIRPIGGSKASTASSFALFGASGVGKSTVVERSLSFLPQILHHQAHKFIQVVWMKLDCPLDGSLKQLLLSILSKFDDLLETSYSGSIGSRPTIDELVLGVAKIAAGHHLGILVIDEIQNLLDSSGVGQAKMLNFFVTFANVVKIPVITIGTPRAVNLLGGTFREARRVGDHGTVIWSSFSFDDEWSFFLEGLWKYQWTVNFIPLTDKISRLMYDQTQGIHALVVRLFQLSQIQAIRDGDECLTSELILRVAHDKFKLVAPMLDALRKGDMDAINRYEDLLNKGLNQIASEVDKDAKIALLKEQLRKRSQSSTERTRTVSALIAMGLEQNQAQELSDDYFKNNPDETCNAAVRSILGILKTGSNSKETNDKSLVDIVKAASSDNNSVSALASAGLIPSTIQRS